MAWRSSLVEYFTPESLRKDWEGMRRFRLMLGVSFLGLTLGGLYGIFYSAIGHYWGATIIAVCIVLQVCVPFLIRATGSVRIGGHLSLVVWGMGFSLLTGLEGGIHGFGIVWLVCGGPLLALLILERREALLWCAFCFFSTLVFAALEIANVSLPPAYPEQWQPYVRAASVIGLFIFMALMGILFEYARKEAVISMEAAFNDLSEANQRTHQSEHFVRQIADTMPGLVYMFDLKNQTIVYANEPLVQLLGDAPRQDVGIRVEDLKKSARTPDFETILRELLEQVHSLKDTTFTEREYTSRHNGIESYWDCRNAVFSRTPTGEPLFVLGIAANITEQKGAERAKLAAEGANRAKDQFLGVLSHELRTPLTPVLAAVTEMENREDLSHEVRIDMAMIRRNVELEAKLIEDLLDVTRISSGKLVLHLATVDVHSCMQSAIDICRTDIEAKELQISISMEAGHHHVHADPVRLRQVFWNLLNNSVKFTPKNGSIYILTRNMGEKLQIEFRDTGVGIEPAVISRIFNAFEQGEQTRTRVFGGLGLGLSIAKTVVEMHHGHLTAASAGKDKGATFTVELTSVVDAPAHAVLPEASKPSSGTLRNVLLVEDDQDTRQVLSRLLHRRGYAVITAEGVQNGLEMAKKHRFDLIISDLGLPDGSGLELMRQIKLLYGVPGIALSGYGTEEDIRQSKAAGFDEHITKPVNFATLHATIQRIIGG